jgi:hypothetical protein
MPSYKFSTSNGENSIRNNVNHAPEQVNVLARESMLTPEPI